MTSGYDPVLAEETATRMGAIGGYRRVLLNDEALAGAGGAAKVALLAHELTHSLQYQAWRRHPRHLVQWLREGLAEWVAARVVAALGVQSLSESRGRRVDLLRGHKGAPVALGEMATFRSG